MKVEKEISYVGEVPITTCDIPITGCQPIRIKTYSGDCIINITTVGSDGGFYRRFSDKEEMKNAIREIRRFLEAFEEELSDE